MKTPLTLVLVLTVLTTVALEPAVAGGKKKRETDRHETLIESVSPTAVNVSKDNASKSVPINQYTEITVKGQKATLADLKTGQMVNITYGVDGVTASRINAEDAPPEREEKPKVKMPKGWMK